MSCSALAFADRSTESWHQTSVMIQKDMKIIEPQSDPILWMGVTPERSLREESQRNPKEGTMMEVEGRVGTDCDP